MTSLYNIYEAYLRAGGVSTDSRRIEQGVMFFALRGDNFDGNGYVAGALEAGAGYAVMDSREVWEALGEEHRAKCFLVEDTLMALQELAAHHRRQLGIPVLAITGSNGKTTTKELLGRVLEKEFFTAVTQGNLNNHIGVPLTLLAMGPNVEFAVVEMGASHQGEIERLCEIAAPNYGLITNIGKSHLEGFGGPEGVRKGKGELYDHLLDRGGTAFYFAGSLELSEMIAEREGLENVAYDVAGFEVHRGEMLDLTVDGVRVRTNLVGSYNLYNIAAAFAVGRYFGVGDRDIASAVESYVPDNNRSQKVDTGRNTVIMDAYNANPSSMRAALENFAAAPVVQATDGARVSEGAQARQGAQVSQRPKAVILGDMGELGVYAPAEHEAIIRLLAETGIDEVYLAGREFTAATEKIAAEKVASKLAASNSVAGNTSPQSARKSASKAAVTFPNTAALIEYLRENPLTGRYILIKGSRSAGLERIMEQL